MLDAPHTVSRSNMRNYLDGCPSSGRKKIVKYDTPGTLLARWSGRVRRKVAKQPRSNLLLVEPEAQTTAIPTYLVSCNCYIPGTKGSSRH